MATAKPSDFEYTDEANTIEAFTVLNLEKSYEATPSPTSRIHILHLLGIKYIHTYKYLVRGQWVELHMAHQSSHRSHRSAPDVWQQRPQWHENRRPLPASLLGQAVHNPHCWVGTVIDNLPCSFQRRKKIIILQGRRPTKVILGKRSQCCADTAMQKPGSSQWTWE